MKTFLFPRLWLAAAGLFLALAQSASAQNFTLTLQPNALTLVPGQTASFVVSMTPLSGFSTNVTLSAGSLPAGVTATFSPNPVTPPGSSLLTLTATTNASVGSFMLNVTGIGGGITNTTASSVIVNFGLLPLCTGGFTGLVTDSETHLPIPGATVSASYATTYFTTSLTNGTYNFTNLPLGNNNIAVQYGLQASLPTYWFGSAQAYAVCDATNPVNLQLVPTHYGSISGTVTIQGGGPAVGVAVSTATGTFRTAVTDASGHYSLTNLGLNYTNAPIGYIVYSQPAGDWRAQSNAVVLADSNSVINLTLIPICYSTVTGQVLLADTLLPASNATVTVSGGTGSSTTNADANGNYVLTMVASSMNNTPLATSVQAYVPAGYYIGTTNVSISNCVGNVAAPTIYLQPVPQNNYGALKGHVYDLQTGLPIAAAVIGGGVTISDANGAYLYTNIFVGTGSTTNRMISLSAIASSYFQSVSNATVLSGVTNTQDLYLLRVAYGGVMGTMRDSATTLPLTNVAVSISAVGTVFTDTNGHYFSGPIPLNTGNTPIFISIFSSPLGYYGVSTNTTITNGITNLIDLNPIKICTGATIVGNVVNALNQQPITNATLFVSGFSSVMTDTNGNFILTNITVGNLNSPIQVTVNASAPGFNPQSHNVTIFCNATITTEFGAPQTAFGSIQGIVSNVVTGLPLVGAFIGSEFGQATVTDTNGFYLLTQAPLGANNSSRVWKVTAIPTNFPAQTLSVSVSSNAISTLNFGFGQPPTHLLVTEAATTNVIPVGSNLVYTITLLNSGADAANVQLINQLSPSLTFVNAAITNPPGGSFTAPIFTNGSITTTATNFAAGQTLSLVVTVIPTISGAVTNITTVTSSTPDTDPTGTNLTAMVINTAVAPVVLHADLGLAVTAVPNPILVSNQLTYSFVLTNAGPADATGVVLDNTLPANTTFISSSNSQGTFTQNASALHWDIGAIANHGNASIRLVVSPLAAGLLSNSATVAIGAGGGGITDTNLGNNTAAVVTTVNAPALTNVSAQALGAPVFNPQTGLFEQTVQFNNLSGVNATGVRLSVLGLPANVTLYNASGSAGGVPYVEYSQAVSAGGSLTFLLEYYNTTRAAFVSTNFTATAVVATSPTTPVGTILQLDQVPVMHNGQLLIEFFSIPGSTYVIQYSADMMTWKTAVPPIVAAGTRIQWIDSGPPKTESPPGPAGQRYYRVVQTGGPSSP